ncbi:hypothetical protein QYM36_008548 [Artemia franciscana]|uniref:Reverse transcriptase domain-containing protein n=1 Tax=Artemia franciscana TaxID=6661 RepID=A0AA88IXL2_ARTSF|nr:hypothetical protein QYM36_008548 [Artemia franciscana]
MKSMKASEALNPYGIQSFILKELRDKLSLFTDDTELQGEASASSQIQSDLDALTEKLEEWQLSPNVAKCSVVHLGHQNPKYKYTMKSINMTKSTYEKDLGVILSLDLKPEKHIGLVVPEAKILSGYSLPTIP